MKSSLFALNCFNHVEHISAITSGLSQHCFKVNADNKTYFAKTIASDVEAHAALCAANQKLSPVVFYHDQQWLITDFINGDNLSLSTIAHAEKITYSINLMTQFHQVNAKPPALVPSAILIDLIDKTHFSAQQRNELLSLVQSTLPPLNQPQQLVCCHGDLNFSNVLVDQHKHAWLVDYECASSAPAEFDLAMFIAINNIADNKISIIIEQYQNRTPWVKINKKSLYDYLFFSYLINSLWYFHAYKKNNSITLLNLYQQQWKKLLSLADNNRTQYEQIAMTLEF